MGGHGIYHHLHQHLRHCVRDCFLGGDGEERNRKVEEVLLLLNRYREP